MHVEPPRILLLPVVYSKFSHATQAHVVVARENNGGYPVTYVYVAAPDDVQNVLVDCKQYEDAFGSLAVPDTEREFTEMRNQAWIDACIYASTLAYRLNRK